jgi:amino acid adenylation domain-containing protein
VRGKVSLLPSTHTPQVIRQLTVFAPDAFCLTDDRKCNIALPRTYFPELTGAVTVGLTVPAIDSEQLAAYVFTSGSTGTPKGVVITHQNVIHFVEWAVSYFGINASDRNSGHSPLYFDLSQFDIFATFAAGAQLHLVPAELSLIPNRLADFIRSSELTQWFSVPSVLNYMARFDAIKVNDFPRLRRLLWCGEVLPTPTLIYCMKRLPHVTFTNLYGPTETTIASSYYTVPSCPESNRSAVPIGTACAGEELLVLDESLEPVKVNEIGDLYISGVGLSPGYWRDPENSQAAFRLQHGQNNARGRIYKTGDLARVDADGLIYYVGRSDSQVKSRGYRIELGEIEAALNALGNLRESAVVAITSDGFEGVVICGAYVSSPEASVNPAALQTELRKVLPSYMLPARWMAFDHLPKNSSGKIDRPQLRRLFEKDGIRNAVGATQSN